MNDGRYNAKACEGALGYTSTGNPQVAVDLEVTSGESAGTHVTWYGYFTPDTQERTFKALRTMGWAGDDLGDLSGIEANEVSITLKSEEYKGEWKQKVAWVNPLGGVVMKDRMDPSQLKSFAAQMKGAAITSRGGNGAKPAPKPKGKPMREPGEDVDDVF